MATYRLYFRESSGIVGRDDFDADDDASALMVAQALADACSDRCTDFELWQCTRRIDACLAKGAVPSFDKIADRVIEREMAIRDSRWAIADSTRLLEQTSRLLQSARESAH